MMNLFYQCILSINEINTTVQQFGDSFFFFLQKGFKNKSIMLINDSFIW